MRTPLAYAIDFGTTNSSVAIAYEDGVDVVGVETGSMAESLRSIVYLHRDKNRAVGREAVEQYLVTGSARTRCDPCALVDHFNGQTFTDCRQHREGGSCHDARLITGLKSELSQVDFDVTHSWAEDFSLPDLVAIVLRRLKRSADYACGSDVRRLVLGHPVLFAGAEGPGGSIRQEVALDRLRESALAAGFEEVILLDEPAAAVMDEPIDEGLVLAVDFGGGTFDVALMQFSPDSGEVVALQGVAVGGEAFDGLLFEAKVAPALGLHNTFTSSSGKNFRFPSWIRGLLRTLAGAKHLLANPDVAGILRDYASYSGGEGVEMIEEMLYSGHAFAFYEAIEEAKIRLSENTSTSIEFHRNGTDVSIPIHVSIPVDQREFGDLIAPSMKVIRESISLALEEAEVRPEDVDLVLRTGGSSSIPAFVSLLEDIFGPTKVEARPAFITVVRGLGTYARGEWGK